MFNLNFPRVKPGLDGAIDRALEELTNYKPTDDEHETIVDQLKELYDLRANDMPEPLSYNTLATVVANIVIVGWIVKYEQAEIITTKAMNFILKLR